MSVENVSSGLVPQGQKASDYDNSDPVPPRQMLFHNSKKDRKKGIDFENHMLPLLGLEAVRISLPTARKQQDHQKNLPTEEALYGLKQAQDLIKYGEDILLVQIYVDDIIFRTTDPPVPKRTLVPKDSGFELIAFSDTDHAGCLDTRKSTSGGIQFLGDKLVSWISKKQNCTAMSFKQRQIRGVSASRAQVNV
ncbi:hypothetical protein Tco_0163375 [Tanacetum coccineum]